MRFRVKVDCTADVLERWDIEIPDNTPEDQIEDALWDALTSEGAFGTRAVFLDQDVSGERDRVIIDFQENPK